MMDDIERKNIGKFISLILRHEPKKIDLDLDRNGWADVEELIRKSSIHKIYFTKKELELIVESNDKKRYSFNNDKTKIRANQGHLIPIDMEFEPVEPPEFLFHGTAERFLSSIREQGITKMSRQHIHLSSTKETANKVGARHGKSVVLTIHSGKMYKEGIIFHKSVNGVWLTDYVHPVYIEESSK